MLYQEFQKTCPVVVIVGVIEQEIQRDVAELVVLFKDVAEKYKPFLHLSSITFYIC